MSLFNLFEQRVNMENPAVPLTDPSLLAWLMGPPTDAGVSVTEQSAMNFSAVYRCVSLISGLGGSLPLKVYKKGTKEPATAPLLENPHPEMPALEFWRLSYVHRCLWGNFYAQKVRKRGGTTQFLLQLQPNRVTPMRVAPSAANPAGKVFRVVKDDGTSQILTSDDIFHIPGLGFDGIAGTSPVRLGAQAIGLALGAERYAAKLFGSGNLMSGILKTDQTLTQGQADELQKQWQQMLSGLQRAHQTAVLDAGLEFQSLTMPNDDAQLLESRRFELTEIGRWYGVPPFLLFDHEKSTTWGSGLEQQALGFVKYDLHPMWLAPTEQRITRELLGDTLEARYDMSEILRGDSEARGAYYRNLREIGVLNPNEIRNYEDLPPRTDPGGDEWLDPTNQKAIADPLGQDVLTDPNAPPPAPAPATPPPSTAPSPGRNGHAPKQPAGR